MSDFGLRPIPAADLAQITTPTSLIWGRQDLQTPLRVAEAASAKYGWPLHVIDGARDDPFFEQPAAALRALRAELPAAAPGRGAVKGPPAYDASSGVTG
jgi:pimeloyl-ACP methyl ester carboxylesterase